MIDHLPQLRIGPIRPDVPVVLAAMSGYTDLAYRTICRQLGALICATEMMLDRLVLLPGKLRRRLIHTDRQDHPVAAQIAGNDPAAMAAAAADLAASGFDAVEINMACPVRKVITRRRGGHLLKDPALAGRIIRAVADALAGQTPLTLKLRAGFDGDAGSAAFWRIVEAAFDDAAAAVCVHARTVAQRYTGRADWELLAEVKRRFPDRTIIGSGDVTDAPAAVAMIRQTGVDGVAFARAAIGNPWIFGQFRDHIAGAPLRKPPLAQQRQVMQRHFELALKLYGPRRGPRHMTKFGIKYSRLHTTPAKVRAAFVAARNAAGWQRVLEKFYPFGDDEPQVTGGKAGPVKYHQRKETP